MSEITKALAQHANDYLPDAWRAYSPQELGNWIHLLLKRAGHRKDKAKRAKDIEDAQNYLHMLQSHVDNARLGQ